MATFDFSGERSRRELRTAVRTHRRQVSSKQRASASQRICESFLQLDVFQRATKVAGFLAFDGEADPLELMVAAERMGKQVFVPVIVGRHQPLRFARWLPDMKLSTNALGIDEPQQTEPCWIAAASIDLVITPLIAFDARGNRLGVGAGYYDRSFEFLQADPPSPLRPTRLFGFAFEFQRVAKLSAQSWDVRLDGVITEQQCYRFDGA